MEVHVLLRWDCSAVFCGGTEAPFLHGGEDHIIDSIADDLQQLGSHYITQNINRDFDDHIATRFHRQFRASDRRIGKDDWQCRPDLMP